MLLAEHTYEARQERAESALETARQHRAAAVATPRRTLRLARTRRTVGHGLVRLGERLAGTEPQPVGRARHA